MVFFFFLFGSFELPTLFFVVLPLARAHDRSSAKSTIITTSQQSERLTSLLLLPFFFGRCFSLPFIAYAYTFSFSVLFAGPLKEIRLEKTECMFRITRL
ncbi:hypothetical protein BJ742DRAFT_819019, partial [Cladochytrium replicatum]